MDAGVPIATKNGKPTTEFIAEINSLRITATMPWLNANTTIADKTGRPTRELMLLLQRLINKVPNANVPIVDTTDGTPSRSFLLLVRA